MDERRASLAEIREVPKESLILLAGPPGAGKSTLCHQMMLSSIAAERPVIFVSTEQSPSRIMDILKEKGVREFPPGALSFVDAFAQTVGLAASERPDTIHASCENLNSISIAITKLQQEIARKDILLAFDSLTSPYLFNKEEVFRFIRLCLQKFAAEGNSVVALIDEGCGKEEDLVAMMSTADGVMKIEKAGDERFLNIVKHPRLKPIRIEVTADEIGRRKIYDAELWDQEMLGRFFSTFPGSTGMGQMALQLFAVNIFWPDFAFWSGMLWDPKRFPKITYEAWKQFGTLSSEMIPFFPWHIRLLLKLLMPKSFSKVKDMKKLLKFLQRIAEQRRDGIVEYLDDVSKTDEHHIKVCESRECCGFENIGATMASILPPMWAGMCKAFEHWKGLERDWNAIETRCIGLGDPYCEFKFVPGEIDGLENSLEKDSSVIERIHERLMQRLMGFLLHGKSLVERPRLGNDFVMAHPDITLPAMAGERYQIALRMGGARSGKEVGERLMDAGVGEDEAVKRILNFLEHCKIGKVMTNETIRIKENRESIWTKIYTTKWEEPSCYFTTGFLNGFFSVIKNQHVREIRCIATGDPYCEWEIV